MIKKKFMLMVIGFCLLIFPLAFADGEAVADNNYVTEDVLHTGVFDGSKKPGFFQKLFNGDLLSFDTPLGQVESPEDNEGVCSWKKSADSVFISYGGYKDSLAEFSPENPNPVRSGAQCNVGDYIRFAECKNKDDVSSCNDIFAHLWYKSNSDELLRFVDYSFTNDRSFFYTYNCYECSVDNSVKKNDVSTSGSSSQSSTSGGGSEDGSSVGKFLEGIGDNINNNANPEMKKIIGAAAFIVGLGIIFILIILGLMLFKGK